MLSLTTPIHYEFTLSNVQNKVKLKNSLFLSQKSLNCVLIKLNYSKTKIDIKKEV